MYAPMLLPSYYKCLIPEVDICGQCGINVELNLGDALLQVCYLLIMPLV